VRRDAGRAVNAMKAERAARAGRRTPAAPRRPSLPSAAAQTTYQQQQQQQLASGDHRRPKNKHYLAADAGQCRSTHNSTCQARVTHATPRRAAPRGASWPRRLNDINTSPTTPPAPPPQQTQPTSLKK